MGVLDRLVACCSRFGVILAAKLRNSTDRAGSIHMIRRGLACLSAPGLTLCASLLAAPLFVLPPTPPLVALIRVRDKLGRT